MPQPQENFILCLVWDEYSWSARGVLPSGGSALKGSARQGRRCGFNPWVRKIPQRRAWQPTPVFLPGGFHGQRSLVGYSPWSHKESDTTEQLHFPRLFREKKKKERISCQYFQTQEIFNKSLGLQGNK